MAANGQVIKGYELQERIGSGGFGAVYRARQTTVDREVAVKIILPGFANQPEFIRRFEVEAQTIARLEHLHIVPLYDYWRELDGAYLVMRWMRGGSLRDALDKHGPYELETASQILEQITSALTTAHRNQVIHRDLKPGNILLDEDGNAYLADFGIAKDIAGDSVTESDAIIGSPDYLAPEQARSEPVTPQTDVYSLGVVLYEMLAGEHPFPNLPAVQRLYKHLSEPLPWIGTLEPDAIDSVNAVIQKATAKNPAQRYEDALALAAAFREAAALGQAASSDTVVEMLTRREQEILHYIIEGRTNKEIASQLFVTVATVKWYITQIYRKLHVRSRMQAIVRARELNLVVSPGQDEIDSAYLDATVIPTDQFQPDNPYKGLRAFEAADHRDFFGRERLIQKLVASLSDDVQFARFLAVVGPSGSGKSSLVKAGLIPAIWRGEIPDSERWFVVEMVPGSRPLDELEVALTRIATTQPGNLNEQLRRDKYGLQRAAGLVLPDDGSELLLVIDQFEEVFTVLEDESDRAHFLSLLYTAVTEHRSRVRVVITLRADYYDRPLHYPDFGELVRRRMETILPMSVAELEQAIVGPAEQVGVTFETGLVAAIIEEIHYQAGALPLLQYALTELFEQRAGRSLTQQVYEEIGRATGALAQQAERLFRESDEAWRETIHQMFLRLVTLSEGAEDTRRRVPRAELLALASDDDLMDDVIDTFAAHRLLSLDHDPATHQPTVEVAHEALLREWSRLEVWLSESRRDILTQRQFAQLAQDWEDSQRDASFLLRGSRLEQFENWAAQTDLAFTPSENAFLQASIAAREQAHAEELAQQAREIRLEKRARNVLRGLVAVFLVAALVASGLAALAFDQRRIAQDNEAEANRSAELSQSLALASGAQAAMSAGNTEQALALAAAANQIGDPPGFAQRTLYEAAFAPGTQSIISGGDGWRWTLAVSPDRRLVASNEDGVRITVWDVETQEIVMRLDGGHTDAVAGAAFTPDGQRLLSSAYDDLLILWDLNSGDIIWQTENPTGDPNVVDIAPDGSLAIAATEQGVATLWDMQSGELIGELVGHNPDMQLMSARFSPDGRWAATGSEDGTAIIWNVETREMVHRLEGHDAIVFSVAFSPDGRALATGGFDANVRLWDVATGQMLRTLSGHTGFVFSVAWSPDGAYVLSASRDSTLILWDVETGVPLHVYSDETGRALSVAFLDDQHAVSGASSGNLRVWSLYDKRADRQFDPAGEPILSMALDNLTQVGAFGLTNAVIVVDMETGAQLHRFEYDGGDVTSVALSPDAQTLVAGFEDSTISAWDTQTDQEIRRFEGHRSIIVNEGVQFGRILDLAFSPDGQRLLSASEDRTLIVWDMQTGAIVHRFESSSDSINTGAFSPDGRLIAGGFGSLSEPTQVPGTERDYTIHLWDATTGEEIRQFAGHAGAITTVQFSADGKRLISGAVDETVRVWDVESGTEVMRFDGHTGGVLSVDISANGQYIVSGALDGIVKIWSVQNGELLRQLTGHQDSVNQVNFAEGYNTVWSSSADGSVRRWVTALALDNLLEWISAHRYVRDLTCSEQQLYLLVTTCD